MITKAVVALLMVGTFLVPFEANGQQPAIRVMSFNVRYANPGDGENAWPRRRAMVLDVLHRFDPDILGLQEPVPQQMSEIQQALATHVLVGCGRDDGQRKGEFTAMLIRSERLEIVEQGRFWFSETPETPGSLGFDAGLPRLAVWALVADKQDAGRQFVVYNTHFDHQSHNSRQHAGLAIAAHMATRTPRVPMLVLGDFNTTLDNAALQALVSGEVKLHDTFAEHAEIGTSGTFHGFNGAADGPRIDYILASADWQVEAATIDHTNVEGRYPSDHFPVTATVKRRESE